MHLDLDSTIYGEIAFVPFDDVALGGFEEPDEGADGLDPLAGGGATRRSIWPAIYPELLELVQQHNSTIIFVNNRRGAERLAKRLNELANEEPEQELPATEHGGNGKPADDNRHLFT